MSDTVHRPLYARSARGVTARCSCGRFATTGATEDAAALRFATHTNYGMATVAAGVDFATSVYDSVLSEMGPPPTWGEVAS